ncbi:hypothetical protein fugu_001435 [Takifugu bimaculatus]|uniref:LIM domain only protein 7 n=1 Tax=Takifugu bimaculatus TaxID=433685 RepID=A0A4Z2CJQ0_9TELE|nr:hypothetical protein fugu_001435 [Takifugu bimaculatus]
MEWREQSSLGCAEAYLEAQRWIEAVTKKTFGSDDFRSALENGILLCDLINKIKPGTIKRINRLPTPIAGLDNLNVFLRACGKLGLKDAQLFHPGDLQDLSSRVTVKDQETNRRLKNVLITIYWLGRRAQCDQSYDGPYLNFKAFEGLLGTALYKALHESPSLRDSSIRDSGFGDSWYSEREEPPHFRGAQAGGGGSVHKRDNSLDSLNSLSSQAHSISSDTTIKGSSEGCCSDTEADSVFKMTDNTQNISYRRSVSITPKATAPFNQFLPSKDKSSGYVPAPLRKKRAERNEDIRHSWASASSGETQPPKCGSVKVDHLKNVCTDSLFKEVYNDSEDEDDEVGYADPIQDDLYARKMGIKSQPFGNECHNQFLPKLWTPEEDFHIQKIKTGSQRRPWYKKIQGFSPHIQAHCPPQLPEIQPPLLQTPPLVFAPMDPTSGPKLVKCQRWPIFGRKDLPEPPDTFDYESVVPDLENDDMFTRRTLTFQSNMNLAMAKTQLPSRRRLCTSDPQLNIITQKHKHGIPQVGDFPDIEMDDVVYRKEKTQQAQQQRPLSGAPDNYAPMPIPEPWALPPDLKARLLCPPCPLTQEEAASNQDQVEKDTYLPTDDMLIRKLGNCPEDCKSSLTGPPANPLTPSVTLSCCEADLQRWQAIREASQLRYKKRLMVERLAALKMQIYKSTNDIQLPVDAGARRYELLQKFRDQIKESESQWQDDLSKWKNRRRSVNSDIVKKKEEREKIEQITSSDNYSRRSKTFREMQDERETKGRLTSLSYLEEDVFDKSVVSPQPRKFPARSQTIDSPYYSYDTHDRSLKQDEPPTASTATGRAASPPTSREVDIVDGPAGRDQVQSTTTSTRHSSFHSSQSTAVAPLRSSLGPSYSDTAKTEKTTTAASSFSSVQKVREPTRPLLRTKAEVEIPSSGAQTKYQPQPSSMESNPPALSRVSASLPRSYQRSDSARLTSVVAPRPFGAQTSRITSLPRAFTAPSRYQQFMTSEDEADSSSAHSSNEEEEEEEVEKDRTTVTSTSVSTVLPPVKDEALGSSAPVSESVKESHCEMRISLNQKPNSSRDFGFQAVWDSTGARVMSVQPGSQAEMCQLQAGDEVLTVNRHQVAEMSYTGWKSRMEEALQEGSLVMDIRRHGKDNWDRAQPSLPFKSHKTINLTSTDHPILLGSSEKSSVNASLDFTSRVSTDTQAPREPPTRTVIDVASSGVNGGFCEEPLNMRNKESESISLKNLKRRSEFFEKGNKIKHILVPPIVPPASRWSWDPEEERRRQEKWQKEQERLLQEKYKRDQEKLQAEWLKAQQEIAKNTEQQQQPRTLAVNSQSPVSISPRAPLSPLKQATSHPWEEEERKRKEEQEQQWQAERRRREEEEREQQRLQAERRRKEEEEERERQRLQAERRRKEEEEERERQQLQAERRRKEEEERRRLEEEELLWQKRRAQEREDERRRQEAAEQLRRERERAAQQQQQWHGSSYGFSNSQSSLSFTDRMKSKSTPQLDQDEKTPWKGVNVQQHLWWERPLPGGSNTQAQSQRAASEQDLKRRYILDSIRIRTLERANSRAVGDSRGQQPPSQANVERQQILNEMKKKIPLLTDSSWIRQGSSSTASNVRETNLLPMRRGESLDNLDAPSTWRSSWTPRSNAFVPNHNPLPSAFSGSDVISSGGSGVQRPSTLLSSYSVGHLRGGAGMPSFPSSKQSPLPSPLSPTRSAEPWNNAGSRSVSGKKICTFCDIPLGKGAAMIIESLGLCYHLSCFKCFDCKAELGGSEAGAEVRIRNKQLYCNLCYMRFKTATPTEM